MTFNESSTLKNQYKIFQGDSNHKSAPLHVKFETPTLKERAKDRVAIEDIGTSDIKETDIEKQ